MKTKLIIISLILIVAAIYFNFSSHTSTLIGINEISKDGNLMANDIDTALSKMNVTSLLDSELSNDIAISWDKSANSAEEFTTSTMGFAFYYLVGLILAPILIFLMRILILRYKNNDQTRGY